MLFSTVVASKTVLTRPLALSFRAAAKEADHGKTLAQKQGIAQPTESHRMLLRQVDVLSISWTVQLLSLEVPARSPGCPGRRSKRSRRLFTEEFKREAVALLLDGHSATSVAERLGLSNPNLLYRWKSSQLERSGPVAASLEARVHELEVELQRVTRERDILKKALVIFGRQE